LRVWFCNLGDVGDELQIIFSNNPSLNDVDRFRYCFMASDKNICHVIVFFFMKVLKLVEGKREKTDLLLKSRHLYIGVHSQNLFIFIMLSFFIVESTNVNNILHGDNKDLLLL
jgi:hypothetical protein